MQSENAYNYYVHNNLPTLATYLLIFLFCPRTFYQFWIQELTPTVLALKLSVILSTTKAKHKMPQYSKDCYVALKKLRHLSLTGMEIATDFQSLVPSFWTNALSLSSCKQRSQHLFRAPNRSD